MKDKSRFIPHFFLFISILFLFYVIHRSEIYHEGTEFHYYLKYYILALSSIFVSFITYFISRTIKINLLVFFISILLALYITETYLSSKHKKFETYKNLTNKNYDQRTKFKVYTDLKKDNPNIVVSPNPAYFTDRFDISPLSGIADRTTLHCNENGYYSIYESDRYGFNNPDLEWDKNIIEFLLIGDSMVRGACVNEPDTISGNIKRLINKNNGVLNLGFDGDGPLREYATLKEYLYLKNVKRVVWFYSEPSDLKELNDELKHSILTKYLIDPKFSQNLSIKKQKVQKLLLSELAITEERARETSLFEEKTKRSSLVNFLILKKTRIFFLNRFFYNIIGGDKIYKEKDYSYLMKDLKKIINLSNQLSIENNSKFYFVYLPSYQRFQSDNNDEYFRNYKKIVKIVEDLNIPVIDINKELFNKIKDPLILFPFSSPGHYNAKGYELIARIVFEKINNLER